MGAGDHVDGVGEHGRPRADRQAAHARREPQHERSKHRAADADDQALPELARLERRAVSSSARRQQASDAARIGSATRRPSRRNAIAGDRGEHDPDQHADADHRRPPGPDLRQAVSAGPGRTARRPRRPLRIGSPVMSLGFEIPSRARIVGARSVERTKPRIRVESEVSVPSNPLPAIPSASARLDAGRRPLDRDRRGRRRASDRQAGGRAARSADSTLTTRAVSMTARACQAPRARRRASGRACPRSRPASTATCACSKVDTEQARARCPRGRSRRRWRTLAPLGRRHRAVPPCPEGTSSGR